MCICIALILGVSICCHIPKSGKPFCGTNGVSYVNINALQCHNKLNRGESKYVIYLND